MHVINLHMQSPDSLFQGNSDALCILCRGSKLLCGKERCPVLVKFYSNVKVRSLTESLNIDGIGDFRSQLVRGKHTVHIKQLDGSRIIEATREMALCSSPVDVEAEFLEKPSARLVLDDGG